MTVETNEIAGAEGSNTTASGLLSTEELEGLRAKYRQERDKRLRPDGRGQYSNAYREYQEYMQDPYAAPIDRAGIAEEVDVVIVGAGFGGMLSAARLHEQGIADVRLIEIGGDVGGTWYWNRYPGAQCDVESYCYLPLLEELGYVPKEKYSYQPEIYSHARNIAEHYELYDKTLFQTRVTDMAWDEDAGRWTVTTDRGDAIRARFVITCTGAMAQPKMPAIPGIEDFKGHSFHTSRWDYDYTGGHHGGDLSKLADKRVAIIGTGATAVQAVPYLGRYAKQLIVIQRTPSSVDRRNNRPTDPDWAGNLKPGWQDARRENFNNSVSGVKMQEDLVQDGWTDIFRSLGADLSELPPEDAALIVERADGAKMNSLRRRIDDIVADPATADALKPWYRHQCKRPTFNDDYLATFNRPNVSLIDVSEGRGVERITQTGIVCNGVELEVDCIVFSTGFEFQTSWVGRQGYDPVGRDGVLLSDHWQDGMRTLHGFLTSGFPNYFLSGLSQNGATTNFTYTLDKQAQHIAWMIAQTMARGARAIEPKREAEDAWVAEIRGFAASAEGLSFLEACTPGYSNAEGRAGKEDAVPLELYTPGFSAFNDLMRAWRDKGDMEGMELR